jgi:hypothetical protein
MAQVFNRQTLVICCQYVYYRKAPNKTSIRHTCRECDASLTIENETNRIMKVNGKRIRKENNLEDEIKRSHRNCE